MKIFYESFLLVWYELICEKCDKYIIMINTVFLFQAIYSERLKSERSDFGTFRFGSVVQLLGMRTTSEIRTILFGF